MLINFCHPAFVDIEEDLILNTPCLLLKNEKELDKVTLAQY